jgi:nucleoside 2-deoxyribosyltransferase
MTNNQIYCPISGDPINKASKYGDFESINCPACGKYKIDGSSFSILHHNQYTTEQRAILSHYVRQQNAAGEEPFFLDNLIKQILRDFSLPKLGEQTDNLILYLGKNTTAGKISQFYVPALTASAGALDKTNTAFICEYLFKQNYVIHDYKELVIRDDSISLGLTMKGWERFYELEKGMVDRRIAFMAMPFNDDRLDRVYKEWFKPACKAVGFELRRVDEKPEAGIINNKMLVDIRKSRFVIAELTDENRGVYWEAGFAEGLGRPVIYTCDKKYEEKIKETGKAIHFDINHHQIVFWTDDDLLDAAKRLVITIQATIPEATLVDVNEIKWPTSTQMVDKFCYS